MFEHVRPRRRSHLGYNVFTFLFIAPGKRIYVQKIDYAIWLKFVKLEDELTTTRLPLGIPRYTRLPGAVFPEYF